MSDSWRCARCDIDYPDEGECVGCLDTLWFNKGQDWDSDWKKKASRAAAQREFNASPYIPDIDIEIIRYKDRLWVAESLLQDKGYIADDFAIVKIQGSYYELQSRKNDGETPAWLIEEVDPDYSVEDLPELSPMEYRELEKRRGLRT